MLHFRERLSSVVGLRTVEAREPTPERNRAADSVIVEFE